MVAAAKGTAGLTLAALYVYQHHPTHCFLESKDTGVVVEVVVRRMGRTGKDPRAQILRWFVWAGFRLMDASGRMGVWIDGGGGSPSYELRGGDRREPRSVERSVELLAFSQSSSCGLSRCAMFAASVAWRHSAPPSERTVNKLLAGKRDSQVRCERTMPL